MTLANCKKLLAHYEKTGNKAGAEDMRRKIAAREETANTPVLQKGKK